MKRTLLVKLTGLSMALILAVAPAVPSLAAEDEAVTYDAAFEIQEPDIEEMAVEEENGNLEVPVAEEEGDIIEVPAEEEGDIIEKPAVEESDIIEEPVDEEECDILEEPASEEDFDREETTESGTFAESGEEGIYAETDAPSSERGKKSREEYSIYYDLGGGTLTRSLMSYKSGKRVALPAAKRTGYKFLGWAPGDEQDRVNLEFKNIKDADGKKLSLAVAIKKTAEATVYLTAVYEPVRYKVYLAPNGKGVRDNDTSFNKKKLLGIYDYEGKAVGTTGGYTPGTLTKRGSRFIGFSLNPKAKSTNQCISLKDMAQLTTKSSVTVYCAWERIPYSLKYLNEVVIIDATTMGSNAPKYTSLRINEFAGEYVKEQRIYYGTSYKPGNIEVPGCTFVCWKDAGGTGASLKTNSSGKIIKIKADNECDVVMRGYYIENSYKLKLSTNGGTININGKDRKGTIEPFKGYASPVIDPSKVETSLSYFRVNVEREGYRLKGLYLDPKGKKPIPADLRGLAKKIYGTVTVYAVWKKEK